jgi:hypothetical protein
MPFNLLVKEAVTDDTKRRRACKKNCFVVSGKPFSWNVTRPAIHTKIFLFPQPLQVDPWIVP